MEDNSYEAADDESVRTNDPRSTSPAFGRRNYLRLAGAATVGSVVASGGAEAATSRRGIAFQSVVNVEEANRSGETYLDTIQRVAADDTLLEFPSGTYPIGETRSSEAALRVNGYTNIGFYGNGDVRWRFPEHSNQRFICHCDGNPGLLFEGIDVTFENDQATPGLKFIATDRLEVHDVEMTGQGVHPDSTPRDEGSGNPDVQNALPSA